MTFVWPVRVYWEDTDAGGVVYYANYLKFMERARTEFLRARGLDQWTMREETGCVMVIRRVEVDYLQSARLDDELSVEVTLEEFRGASFAMSQRVLRTADGSVLVTGVVTAACLDADSWRPRRFPPALKAALTGD